MKKVLISVLSFVAVSVVCAAVDIVPNPVYKSESGRFVSGRKASAVEVKTDGRLEEEEYALSISKRGVKICGGSEKAVFWAKQTLEQIRVQSPEGELPCLEIKDKPAFPYRGMLIDCSRHFLSVEDVKACIDMMAMHKLNKLHWHITDDQGWRIEIKKYPELTEKGSVRAQTKVGHFLDKKSGYDGTPYGGYYTQDQVREIVRYASERHIDIIPEIEMPGHSQEVLAVFPDLGCVGEGYKVRETWDISDDPFCIANPRLIPFLKDILDEVCELFPGEYINIGGDEVRTARWKACPKCQAFMKEHGMTDENQLQRYLVGEMEKYLLSKGKKMIGWGEIFEGCTDPSTTVLSWRGTETGIAAAKKGMHSVMCPGRWMYLDYYQTPECIAREPLAIHSGLFTTLSKVYSYNPLDGIPEDKTDFVSGIQGNLWGEYITDLAGLQHMALPRLAAVAEVAWSGEKGKTAFPAFRSRVINALLPLYRQREYNYADYEFSDEWTLVWSDEFDNWRVGLDSRVWSFSDSDPARQTGYREYHREDTELLYVRNGMLTVTCRKADASDNPLETANGFVTAGVSSRDKAAFAFGKDGVRSRMEFRARMTGARGWWPALWLVSNDAAYPDGGEIDVMERLNYNNTIYQTIHTLETMNDPKTPHAWHVLTQIDDYRLWHTYAVEGDSEGLYFYVDGKFTGAYLKKDFPQYEYQFDRDEYFILIDGQLGGRWVSEDFKKQGIVVPDGTDIPAKMDVDYIRYYKKVK